MTGSTDPREECGGERADDHLQDVAVGAGCTEIREHLAERREDESGGGAF